MQSVLCEVGQTGQWEKLQHTKAILGDMWSGLDTTGLSLSRYHSYEWQLQPDTLPGLLPCRERGQLLFGV